MLDAYRDLIDGLLHTPKTIREKLGTPVPDDVSDDTRTLIRELRIREQVELARVQRVMFERQRGLGSIETEVQQATNSFADDVSSEELLASFGTDRSELVSLLINLTLSDWDRSVDDAQLGQITLADEIERHLEWDESMVEKLTPE